MADVRIGCSGWVYRHWKGGVFYPEGLRAADELAFYASRFSTAELNGSFYRLPTDKAVDGWRERTPDDFVFAWKASRYLTHQKRLKEPEDSVALMFSRADRLGEKLACVLYQLPPSLKRDDERLAACLKVLPKNRRHAFEFRDPSWYEAPVFDLLREHDASLCLSDHHHAPAPWEATASWVYVRGHGPTGGYWGSYSDETLSRWAAQIRLWRSEGRDVFCYFDNDIGGAAPQDADRLTALLEAGSNAPPSDRRRRSGGSAEDVRASWPEL